MVECAVLKDDGLGVLEDEGNSLKLNSDSRPLSDRRLSCKNQMVNWKLFHDSQYKYCTVCNMFPAYLEAANSRYPTIDRPVIRD